MTLPKLSSRSFAVLNCFLAICNVAAAGFDLRHRDWPNSVLHLGLVGTHAFAMGAMARASKMLDKSSTNWLQAIGFYERTKELLDEGKRGQTR